MRRLTLLATFAGFAAIGACALALYLYERPTVLRVAVTRGSGDQEVLSAAAYEFAQSHEQLGLKLVLVDSLAESGRAFEDQKVDLAIVRSDVGMPVNGQTVLIMRRNAALLLAPAGSALHDVEDLKGRRIGILQTEQAGRPDDNGALLDAALAQSDIPLASVGRAPLTLAELPDAIERRDVDAVLAIGTPGSANLTEAVTAMSQAGHGPPVFIPIAEAKAIAQVWEGAPQPAVSSTKPVHGHQLGATGATEIVVCMLAIRDSLVPHTLNCDNPDDDIAIDIVRGAPRQMPVKAAMSNSFGFGGHNAVLIAHRYEQ